MRRASQGNLFRKGNKMINSEMQTIVVFKQILRSSDVQKWHVRGLILFVLIDLANFVVLNIYEIIVWKRRFQK